MRLPLFVALEKLPFIKFVRIYNLDLLVGMRCYFIIALKHYSLLLIILDFFFSVLIGNLTFFSCGFLIHIVYSFVSQFFLLSFLWSNILYGFNLYLLPVMCFEISHSRLRLLCYLCPPCLVKKRHFPLHCSQICRMVFVDPSTFQLNDQFKILSYSYVWIDNRVKKELPSVL